jgi:phosphoribosylformylglycinamidine cyclo-ligase
MVLIVPEADAEKALKLAEEHGEKAYRLGRVTAGEKIVTFTGAEV